MRLSGCSSYVILDWEEIIISLNVVYFCFFLMWMIFVKIINWYIERLCMVEDLRWYGEL